MDSGLKQRLIGAAVLIALAVIFLPMLVQGPAPDSGVSDLSLQVPDAPTGDYVTRDLPLVVPEATGASGLLADDGRLATVDTATAAPEGDTRHQDAAELAADLGAEPMPPGDTAGPADAADATRAAGPSAATSTPTPRNTSASAEPATPSSQRPVEAADRDGRAATPASTPAPAPAPSAPESGAGPAGKPAPRLPAATAGGDYAVHFGAYATRADAGIVVERLRRENLPAYIEEARVGNRDAWRVRIGPYASRADAEAARVRASGIGSRAQATVIALDAATPAAPGAIASRPATTATAPASTTPASTAATPSAAAGTGFAVQLGAFGNATDANALRDRLRAAGIGAFTDTVQTDKGTLTRVKAGPVATRAEAEQLKARVKSSFDIDGLVRSHP